MLGGIRTHQENAPFHGALRNPGYQLTREGYRVETALTGAAALYALDRDLPDLLTC